MTQPYYIHLISDSTGYTAQMVARSCLAQFKGVKFVEQYWPMVRNDAELNRIVDLIRKTPGVIIFTITDFEHRMKIRRFAKEIGVPAISPIADTVASISNYFNITQTVNAPGAHLKLDDDYFRQIEAIQFTQQHDDGTNLKTIADADIILIGVSRSSKSPTAFYLAHRGFNVANIPFYHKVKFPLDFSQLDQKTLVIGLTAHPEILASIRKKRMTEAAPDHLQIDNKYVEYNAICEEVKEALRFFTKHKIPYIDVTKKAVEETVAEIIKLYNEKQM